MKIWLVSIFPQIYKSFLDTSLVHKAIQRWSVEIFLTNPRDFCKDKHKQIDDYPYGGWSGMVLKAKPFIDAVEDIIGKYIKTENFKIVYLSPSKAFFSQKRAHQYAKLESLILISGRYEGIDFRFEQYLSQKYSKKFEKVSIGPYITMGGEVPSMVVVESVIRLLDGVIGDQNSVVEESYSDSKHTYLEYPQYTRPVEVYGLKVPSVLLGGNHSQIKKWREENSSQIDVDKGLST